MWRKIDENQRHWLPELIEVELENDGNVITRQLRRGNQDGTRSEWEEFRGNALPSAVTNILSKEGDFDKSTGERLKRYKLDFVLSFINNHESEKLGHEDALSHHVLHARIPKKEVLLKQVEATKECIKQTSSVEGECDDEALTVLDDLSPSQIQARIDNIESQLNALTGETESDDEWILFNGINASSTNLSFGETKVHFLTISCKLSFQQRHAGRSSRFS